MRSRRFGARHPLPVAAAFALVALAVRPSAQATPTASVAAVAVSPAYRAARDLLARDHDQIVADTITLTEIPAPPFHEDARGKAYEALLRATHLSEVSRDEAGNILGLRKGTGGGPLVAIAAHLDTVFPAGTDVYVKRAGTRLSAPGVGDDTRSLAVLLALIRAMDATGVKTKSDVLFVADVGEEGAGDLRGMKQLFLKDGYKDRIKAFVTMDDVGGPGDITNGAVGSERFRVTFTGPGGHSYKAFGLVNPAFAMGSAIQKFAALKVPATPKTTFNVGVVSGGTSVNSIPEKVTMDVDMRSESPQALATLVTAFRKAMQQAVDEENAVRSTENGRVAVTLDLIGERPPGQTPATAPLVQAAEAVARAVGAEPHLGYASTDANLPISLGIPAIRILSGATGDGSHSPAEWIDVEKTKSLQGIDAALLLLLVLAGPA